MGVLEQLDLEQEDAPTDPDPEPSVSVGEDTDPFSMNYDFEEWKVDAESTDQILSLLIAVTNLL
ncbi:hypothetical protein ACFOZ7_05610 [Natribaculum luteum]|uniref:Uncharacterized protein n=1 Tax=Natribaculum luteum TaxID=1586232 RepID=A0ABD5NWM8_9EURY|nr:hypothetical protein [Natribaculum luteum]